MLRSDDEERIDQDAEREFWAAWNGETECLGTVAKMILLVLIVANGLFQFLT